MTQATARTIVTDLGLRTGSGVTFTNTQIDYGIDAACDDFIWRTKCLRQINDVSISDGTAALPSFSGSLATFIPERLLSCWLVNGSGVPYPPLRVVASHEFNELKRQLGYLAEATPGYITFTNNVAASVAGTVYPIPDAAYTLKIEWVPFYTASSPNIPDHLLRPILIYGVPAFMQHNQPEQGYTAAARQKYEEHVQRSGGQNHLGSSSMDTTFAREQDRHIRVRTYLLE